MTPTPRFPPRGLPPGAVSQDYTPAEQRMIAYVNAVVRNSDAPGSELREACERILAIDVPYFEFREREWNHQPATSSTIYPGSKSELDERIDPKPPQPIAPIAPPVESVPLCKSANEYGVLATYCCQDRGTDRCHCGG